MNDWDVNKGWDFFTENLEPACKNIIPKRVLMTTYGLDTAFVVSELLSTLLLVEQEPETLDWYFAMERAFKETSVHIAVDQCEWIASDRATLLQSLGAKVHPIGVERGAQHAKLWLAEYGDRVRIVIGSANLTRDGFSRQIQYLWSAELMKTDGFQTDGNLLRLQYFLKELAKASTGEASFTAEIGEWCKTLQKVQWPGGVTLIPCLPERCKAVGARGLELVATTLPEGKRYDVDIQVFSVGSLSNSFIDTLSDTLRAKYLSLIWPEENCPVAWQSMVMSKDSKENWLKRNNCSFYALEFDKNIADDAKERLPHGKVYGGYARSNQEYYDWLIVGSSNLSEAAWCRNFELNVLVKGKGLTIPLATCNESNKPWCTDAPQTASTQKNWIEARETVEGVDVTLYGPSPISEGSVEVLDFRGSSILRGNFSKPWYINETRTFKCPGNQARNLALISNSETLYCPVILKFETELTSSVGSKSFEELRYNWVLKSYGWDIHSRRTGIYRVPWVEEAMNVFKIIDRWRQSDPQKVDRDLLKAAFEYFGDHYASTNEELSHTFKIASEEIMKW